MGTGHVRVSAIISAATKEKLDRFTKELGLEMSFVVEQALLYFMASRCNAFSPTRIVLDDDAFDRLVERLESPPAPTNELRELMRDMERGQRTYADTPDLVRGSRARSRRHRG